VGQNLASERTHVSCFPIDKKRTYFSVIYNTVMAQFLSRNIGYHLSTKKKEETKKVGALLRQLVASYLHIFCLLTCALWCNNVWLRYR